jgi:GGDEF domain-containing protein
MSLQGSILVVAEAPSIALTGALSAAGAFPIVEATWADAPTAFVSVKPNAVIIADPGPPPSEANARMLCLQIATARGPAVPVIARAAGDRDAAVPIALPADASLPIDRLIARLQSAMRVRALHATVLRRIETYGSQFGKLPDMPVGDPIEDATVMVVGRGPLYPALSVAMGERIGMIGALSVETAAKHLNSREINGIVIGDGFSARMVEAFLTVLAQDDRFRNLPAAVIGDIPPDLAERLPNVDPVPAQASRIVARIEPPVRWHAMESRLKRMMHALGSEGVFDPQNGLLTRQHFERELKRTVDDAAQYGNALSLGRFSLEGRLPARAGHDAARLVNRLTRDSDFACRDEDGSILIAFTHTDLSSAHVVARRIAAVLKNTMLSDDQSSLSANVTLATLKASDTVDSLLARVNGREVVAAE